MEKKGRDYKYDEPTLLVIDDPVSSFDAENKAGVISLLTRQCKKVLDGNKESKVLIFTHDVTTLRELCVQRSDFFDKDEDETKMYLWLTPARILKPVNCSRILENMEYDAELNTIFNFANADCPEDFDQYDTIGNTIRRFAESYASRMFKCSWNSLFTSESRLECLPEDIQDSVSAFAIRPILNSGSHGVVEEYEPSEVQRAARILLIYMSYASHEHLRSYLVGRSKNLSWRMETIEDWVMDL